MRNATHLIIWLLVVLFVTVAELRAQAYPPIQISVGSGCDVKGSTVCVDVTVENFTKVEGLNFILSFNPNVLRLITPIDLTSSDWPDISTTGIFTIYDNTLGATYGLGNINFLIFESPITTLPDGSNIFSLCFELIGQPGEISPIFINRGKLEPDVTQTSPVDPNRAISGIIESFPGSIKIKSNDLFILSSVCGSTNTADNNGTIRFTPTGGRAPYSYTVNGGTPISGVAEDQEVVLANLPSGNYTIEITDSDLKKQSKVIIVDKTQSFSYIVDIKNPSCFHSPTQNGYIDIDITDGGLFLPETYKFSWSNFEFNRDSIYELGSGKYTVTITDLLGCKTVDSFNLAATPITFDIDVNNTLCDDKRTGSIQLLNAAGGSGGGYRYYFNLADRGPLNVFTNLAAGQYTVRVQDGSGCSTPLQTVTVGVQRDHNFVVSIKNISCGGQKDGTIGITANPSDIRYSWKINPLDPFLVGPTDNTYFNDTLSPGVYQVVSIDPDGCRDTINAAILEQAPIFITANVVQPNCQTSGSISLNPSGGSGTFLYNWDPPQAPNTSVINNINGGVYKVTVSDALNTNCQKDTTITLNQMGSLSISLSNITPVSCDGKNDGSATVNVQSPNQITIVWKKSNGEILPTMTNTITNLAPGSYIVEVSDINSCKNSLPFSIQAALPVNLTAAINQPKCKGDIGQIFISVASTVTNPIYKWTKNGAPNDVIDRDNVLNAPSGTYALNFTWGNGCSKDTILTLEEAQEISLPEVSTRRVSCFGKSDGQATILGLPNNITLVWSSGTIGPFALDFPEGRHFVIGTNANGCTSDTVFFDILTYPKLEIDEALTTIIKPLCFGDKNGSISILAKGGTGQGYTYQWESPNSTSTTLNNISAGLYIVEISDNNNCKVKDTIELSQPDPLVAFVDLNGSILLNCKNTEDGRLVLGFSGGNPGVKTVNWQSGVITDNNYAIRLSAGTYCATVTDNKGCKDTVCYELVAPEKLVGTINPPSPLSCNGSTTCISVNSVTGGTGNSYTFQINNGKRYPIDTCVTVFAGSYFISFIDSSGCSVDTLISITQPDPISVNVGPDIEHQLGFPPITLNASVANNIIVDTAFWSPSQDVNCLTNNCLSVDINPTQTTTYVLTVVDESGCMGTDELIVQVKEVRNVFFANAFSPNGDGFNDFFQVAIGPGVKNVESFSIYDRWGNEVFTKKDYVPDPATTDGWDGTFNGRRLDPGVFVFIARVNFIDGFSSTYKGSVTLLDKRQN
jgi:gliding motility-associated-like protein